MLFFDVEYLTGKKQCIEQKQDSRHHAAHRCNHLPGHPDMKQQLADDGAEGITKCRQQAEANPFFVLIHDVPFLFAQIVLPYYKH